MSATQQIKFFAETRERVALGLATARKANNAALLEVNYRQAFKADLMQGLIRWRHEIGNPRPDLERALSTASDAIREFESIPRASFPFALSAVLSFLLSDRAQIEFTSLLPQPSVWSSCEPSTAREASLAFALEAPEKAQFLLEQVRQLHTPQREQLGQETHELYLSLISGSGNIEQAEQLYHKRRNDRFYSGGVQYYGGGPDNEHVVDFMLAAVIKLSGIDSKSVHAWRWA